MSDTLSPWPERRPKRTERDRSAIAEEMSAHLPRPTATVLFSNEDLMAMKAAFIGRFDEALPRTETLMAVAHIGYRMALRDVRDPASPQDETQGHPTKPVQEQFS